MVMVIDAPAIFLLALFVFPNYLKPDKIIHLFVWVAALNIITVLVYSGCYYLWGFGKLTVDFWNLSLKESLYKLQAYGFREAIHTVFMASLLMGVRYFDFQRSEVLTSTPAKYWVRSQFCRW